MMYSTTALSTPSRSRGLLGALVLFICLGIAGPAVAAENSLYQRLGGLPAIAVVVSDFLDVMVPDPVLNQNPAIDAAREKVPKPYLKYQVTAQVCEATGGPCTYRGQTMKASHDHLNITNAEWQRMVELLNGVLDKHHVPERETRELMEIIQSLKDDIVSAP